MPATRRPGSEDLLVRWRGVQIMRCIPKPAVGRGLRTFALVGALSLAVCGQQARPALTNDHIIRMTKDGFGGGVIVTLIDSSHPATNQDCGKAPSLTV